MTLPGPLLVALHHVRWVSADDDPTLWSRGVAGVPWLAGLVAVVVFIQGGLRLRRRPEARFTWWSWIIGEGGFHVDQTWPSGSPWVVTPGQTLFVRIATTNIGDDASNITLWNFVVPEAIGSTGVVELLLDGHEKSPMPSVWNESVGGLARFFVSERAWIASLTWFHTYRMVAPLDPGKYVLYAELHDSRFNSRGKRWLPSLVAGRPTRWPTWWPERWPPGRWPRRIRVDPNTVQRSLGFRIDERELRVMATSPQSVAARSGRSVTEQTPMGDR